MKAVSLYLLRHGAVISIQGKRYIGQMEAPLSERGVEEAWAQRDWLHGVEFTQAFSSDLTRSVRTARIVLGGRTTPLQVARELREISLGDWEGFSFRDIQQRFPEEYEARGRDLENWRPPNGESFADCRNRVIPFFHDLLERAEGNILLAGHAGVNRLILCEAMGVPVANLMSIRQGYGCINRIDYEPGKRRLQLLNYAPLESRPVPDPVPCEPRQPSAEAKAAAQGRQR